MTLTVDAVVWAISAINVGLSMNAIRLGRNYQRKLRALTEGGSREHRRTEGTDPDPGTDRGADTGTESLYRTLDPGPGTRTVIDPLIGWRCWELSDYSLRSLTRGIDWPHKRPAESHCLLVEQNAAVPHNSPHWDCSCGLYAFALGEVPEPEPIARPAPTIYTSMPYSSFGTPTDQDQRIEVRGLVRAWGNIVLHDDGFRAEYMKPLLLIVPEEPAGDWDWALRIRSYLDQVRYIARLYDVPAMTQQAATQFVKEFQMEH